MLISIFTQIFDKVLIILTLSLILQGLKYNGVIEILLQPLNKLKNLKHIAIFWFLLGALISSISTDLNAAVIICPLILFYCENYNIKLNREILILSGILGVAVGGDLSMYGGGDNLLLVSLFESHFNIEFTNAIWFNYVGPPTLLLLIITAFIICKFIKVEPIDFNHKFTIQNYTPNKVSIILLLIALIMVFYKQDILSIIALILGLSLINTNDNLLKTIPYKALSIWTIAFLVGKLIGIGLNEFLNLTNLSYDINVLLIIFVSLAFFLTSFCTQTFVTSCLIESVFTIFGPNYPILMLMIKAINSNYITILSDSCFPVGQSYGIKPKTLFKIGSILLIPQIIIPIIWYLILI